MQSSDEEVNKDLPAVTFHIEPMKFDVRRKLVVPNED